MPLVSGTELVRLARNIRADWPCVIITGYADRKAISDRPSDVPVLYKPFEHSKLVEVVRNLVVEVASAGSVSVISADALDIELGSDHPPNVVAEL